MRNLKKTAAALTATVTVATMSVMSATPANAGDTKIHGTVICGDGAAIGVYVVNETSSARSGWANLWLDGGNRKFAYDGANSNDQVRLHVGCGTWSPTHVSEYAHSASFYNGITVSCSGGWLQPKCLP